ncbi:hypothetical protein MRX96_030957 [Rhipicephalus microplus]
MEAEKVVEAEDDQPLPSSGSFFLKNNSYSAKEDLFYPIGTLQHTRILWRAPAYSTAPPAVNGSPSRRPSFLSQAATVIAGRGAVVVRPTDRRLPGGRPGRAICKMERTRPQGRAYSVALGEVLLGRRDADGCSLCCRVGRAPLRQHSAFRSTPVRLHVDAAHAAQKARAAAKRCAERYPAGERLTSPVAITSKPGRCVQPCWVAGRTHTRCDVLHD